MELIEILLVVVWVVWLVGCALHYAWWYHNYDNANQIEKYKFHVITTAFHFVCVIIFIILYAVWI